MLAPCGITCVPNGKSAISGPASPTKTARPDCAVSIPPCRIAGSTVFPNWPPPTVCGLSYSDPLLFCCT